jgi:2-polyprenyl-3-methyl-5-hydroxy-6-metoxy-1,4-benzoquinol methylase
MESSMGAKVQENAAAAAHDISAKLIAARRIPRGPVVGRMEEILRIAENKKVLHLGCVDYPFTAQRGDDLLHGKLAKATRELWGLDASAEGIEQLRAMGFPNLVCADAQHLPAGALPNDFDLVIAGEIIEHLASPGDFLLSVRALMSPQTEFLLTTINAFGAKTFMQSVLGREKVHSDHNYYFSYFTLKQLFEKCGLVCDEIYHYQEIRGRGVGLVVERAFAFLSRARPLLSDGLVVRARLKA